jgi:UDP-glucuronate decarboxylase
MLEFARECGARILQASTSEIYGDPLIHPQVESYWGNVNPIGPRSNYDEGKRAAETLMMDYGRQYNIQTRIARIHNTYGPDMDKNDGRVVSNFIVQALNNDPLTIYGDGTQTRSFQYISDLIIGLVKLMNSNYSNPVNIGNPEEYKIIDLAELIIKMTNSKSQLKFCPLPVDDPKIRKPDIGLAMSVLNWTPKIKLYEGLENTIWFFKKLLEKSKLLYDTK